MRRSLALCAALVGNKSGLSPQDPSAQQKYVDLAIQTLRQALDAGYGPGDALDKDAAFDGIRNEPGFQNLAHPPKGK
jgi:hypothetical protein